MANILKVFLNYKTADLTIFEVLTLVDWKNSPRLGLMMRYAILVSDLVDEAKNGVLGHVCLTCALQQVATPGAKKINSRIPAISLGIMVHLKHLRQVKKYTSAKDIIFKRACADEQETITKILENLVMNSKFDEGAGLKK